MVKRGRKPKPTHLKVIEGNPGKRALPDREPVPSVTRPRKPTYWRKGSDASRMWDKLVADLEGMKLASDTDRELLIRYCERWQDFCEARRDVRKRGQLVKGRDGGLVKNPSVQIMRDAGRDLDRMDPELGKTPSGRARLEVQDAAPVDPGEIDAILS